MCLELRAGKITLLLSATGRGLSPVTGYVHLGICLPVIVLTETRNSLGKLTEELPSSLENILIYASVRKCLHNAILVWKRAPEKDAMVLVRILHCLRKSLPSVHASNSPWGRWSSPSSSAATSHLHCECEVEASPKQPPQGPLATVGSRRGLQRGQSSKGFRWGHGA